MKKIKKRKFKNIFKKKGALKNKKGIKHKKYAVKLNVLKAHFTYVYGSDNVARQYQETYSYYDKSNKNFKIIKSFVENYIEAEEVNFFEDEIEEELDLKDFYNLDYYINEKNKTFVNELLNGLDIKKIEELEKQRKEEELKRALRKIEQDFKLKKEILNESIKRLEKRKELKQKRDKNVEIAKKYITELKKEVVLINNFKNRKKEEIQKNVEELSSLENELEELLLLIKNKKQELINELDYNFLGKVIVDNKKDNEKDKKDKDKEKEKNNDEIER